MEHSVKHRLDAEGFLHLAGAGAVLLGLVGLAAARLGVFDALQVWCIAALLLIAYARLARPAAGLVTTSPGAGPAWVDLGVLVLVALLFRWPPYWYIFGEQDQGIYVNTAAHLARTGGLLPVDPVLARLDGIAAAEAAYIGDNYANGLFAAGIYDGPGSSLAFQFYHLFPVWLALFSGLFGTKAAAAGLTVLALLSIVFCYRSVISLTGSRHAGFWAGLLLAISPLHAYFSKYTVSEVPTLAYSLIALAFLVEGAKAAEARRALPLLAISALAVFSLFLTRISGFMYLPIVLTVGVGALIVGRDRGRAIALWGWALVTVLAFAASVYYGLAWSGDYSRDIYSLSFTQAFGARWPLVVTSVALSCMVAFFVAVPLTRTAAVKERLGALLDRSTILLPVLFGLVLLLAAYKGYTIAFTDAYADDRTIGQRFGMAGGGWETLRAHTFWVTMLYLSPFVTAVLLYFGLRRPKGWKLAAVMFFVVMFLAQVGLLLRLVPHQPYFARYLLSELVPFAIVFVACGWAAMSRGAGRNLVAMLFALGVAYGAVLSYMQKDKALAANVPGVMRQVLADVTEEDAVLLLDDRPNNSRTNAVKTAMVFALGTHAGTISKRSLENDDYIDALDERFDRVFVLATTPLADPQFELVGSRLLHARVLAQGQSPVPRLRSEKYDFRLYRRSAAGAVDRRIPVKAGSPALQWLASGWGGIEPWGVWTVGSSAEIAIPADALPRGADALALELDLQGFVSPRNPTQRVVAVAGGGPAVEAVFEHGRTDTLRLRVPIESGPGARVLRVRIETPDAVAPKAVGVGEDMRQLGAGLRALRFVEVDAAARPVEPEGAAPGR